MDVSSATEEYGTWSVSLDADPSSATVQVWLADGWVNAAWVGPATQTATGWTRSCRVLIGGSASSGADVVVTHDELSPLVKIALGSEVIVRRSTDSISVI